jgi:phosphatidylglycerophosphate synthase
VRALLRPPPSPPSHAARSSGVHILFAIVLLSERSENAIAERADCGRRVALRRGLGARLLREPQRAAVLLARRQLFVTGSILDILDGALARTSGKGTPFGALLDSTTDRVSEGFMLGAIALVFARPRADHRARADRRRDRRSFLVSYTRARAEALGLRGDVGIGSRAERVAVITAGLVLAPWGVLPWAIGLLTATAWVTVVQRILFVRSQLRARR